MDLKDRIALRTDTSGGSSKSGPGLIYFITGNPGLVEYYRPFLTHLKSCLSKATPSTAFAIHAESLGGFETDPNATPSLYDLDEQITHVRSQIHRSVAALQSERAQTQANPSLIPVILVGHSVGTYILLETIAARQQAQSRAQTDHTDRPDLFELIAGINLFPTIVHLAASPRGKLLSPLLTLPLLPTLLQLLARILTTLLPRPTLQKLISHLTSQPPSAAAVTAAFLSTPGGVHQALHMARAELAQMTDDRWSEMIWDSSQVSGGAGGGGVVDRPDLFFYWGEGDGWVDGAVRDGVLAARARTGGTGGRGRARMEIDGGAVPHDFCIRYSEMVAEKVAEYVGVVVVERLGG